MDKKAVVVTTKERGVFFGYIVDQDDLPEKITLSNAKVLKVLIS